MKAPTNQTAEVLYELLQFPITRRSIMSDCGILNVTARIADLRLRHNLSIICTKIQTKNKHNRAITYGCWSLENKKVAKEVYDKINCKK
jgi:hypothetical protein